MLRSEGSRESLEIFSIFSIKSSTNVLARSRIGFMDGSSLAGSLCNKSPRTHHNFLGF